MLTFGSYKFPPITLRHSKESRWSVVECIEGMPLLQNIGQGVENIDLEVVIYPHNLNSLDQLKNMKEAAKDQIPNILADSAGNVLGRFVIVRLEEKQTSLLPCGLPKKVEFSLSLKKYS